jgi:hypothetical protein
MARVTIIILALIEGLWMGFDGTRALTVGDYVTPRSGARAGELGPWLIVAGALLRRVPWALNAVFIGAVLTLWYLPVGTAFGVIEIALCILLRRVA